MKTWAFVLLLVASIVPVHHAEARKANHKQQKVVVISFNESDLKQNRGPASVEDQREAAAEARHMARLAEANISIPEF